MSTERSKGYFEVKPEVLGMALAPPAGAHGWPGGVVGGQTGAPPAPPGPDGGVHP